MKKANEAVRAAALSSGVRLWELAQRLGMNDGNLSRKLRVELPTGEQEELIAIVAQIAAHKGKETGGNG